MVATTEFIRKEPIDEEPASKKCKADQISSELCISSKGLKVRNTLLKVETSVPRGSSDQSELSVTSSKALKVRNTSRETRQTSNDAEPLFREQKRVALEANVAYLCRLKDQKELGYMKRIGTKKLEVQAIEIDVTAFRDTIEDVIKQTLFTRYCTHVTILLNRSN